MDYEEIAEAQGWDEDSLLGLMAGFIDKRGLRDEFSGWCEAAAAEENYGLEEW